MNALDDTLEDEGMDDILGLMGDEAFNRCLDLRTSLQRRRSGIESTIKPPPPSQPKSPDKTNLPKSISGSSLTPWTSSTIPKSLPPLPVVLDPTLEAGAFIHHGYTTGQVTDLSYERLEWVGDAYLYLTATLLISQTFPAYLPGKCSQLRERIVKNIQLADYARQYGFEKRAKLPEEHIGVHKHASKESERVKILGDIFEAYIAAVVLSDPVDGVSRCSEWLKGLWGMTLAKDIIAQEREGIKLDSPLWRLRGGSEPVKIVASESERTLNSKDRLRALICSKGVSLIYRDAAPEKKDPATKLPVFTVGVYLDGWGEKDKQLGFGRANGKKDAGMKAAEMALANGKLMKVYVEKKRIFDAQRELEKQTLESS
jgi:ribonuclease III